LNCEAFSLTSAVTPVIKLVIVDIFKTLVLETLWLISS
jgi:hypothetical protein